MPPTLKPGLARSGRVALAGLMVGGIALAFADPITLFFFLAYGTVGAWLITRRPTNPIGWLTLGFAFSFIATTPPRDVDVAALQAGTASMRDFFLVWVTSWSGGASYVGFMALALLFPSGRLPEDRWRGPALALIATGVTCGLLSATAPVISYNPDASANGLWIPNRFAVLPSFAPWTLVGDGVLTLTQLALLPVAVASLLVRYRRASGVERLQLRWLVSAVAFCVAALAIGIGLLATLGDSIGTLVWLPAIVAYPTVPLAIGVAVTRHGLFEIDRIVSRTIGWTIVTAALVVVFAATVVGLQALLSRFTQGETLAVAASTLVAFALFQPLRRRVQSWVDHRFDRARYDADRTVDTFAEQLRNEVDLSRLRVALVDTVEDALRPGSATVWLRARSEGR
jgi:hypothetical protein